MSHTAQSGSSSTAAASRGAAQRFWQRVTDGLKLQELWRQFQAEARVGYGLYSREVDWKALEQARGLRRGFKIVQAFFWALLMKLSPARRVLLLLALVLLFLGRVGVATAHADIDLNLSSLGVLALLLLLALELADRVTMKRDLEIAREIQHWLLPEAAPPLSGMDIAFATRPANTVAGDYYDAFLRPDRDPSSSKLLLVVADVAGKSVPAALLMATFHASLRALASRPGSLEELVSDLNQYSCGHSLRGMRFTTAFLAELDPAARTLHYVCAGHNAPVLRRSSGHTERLSVGGLPLGIEPATSYQRGTLTLGAGDRLVVFTDGVIEAVNPRGEEFGEARLLDLVRELRAETAQDSIARLLASVDAFVGDARQHDDLTCLVLRIGQPG